MDHNHPPRSSCICPTVAVPAHMKWHGWTPCSVLGDAFNDLEVTP